MSNDQENLVLQILKRIQDKLSEHDKRFDHMESRLVQMEARLVQIDEILRKQRRDTAGLLVMAKALSGEFAEELAAIEARVEKLEVHPA